MGTSELTTAEITYNGAIAYPVGPLMKGLANVVGIVLTTSRLTVGLSGAAGMTRAVREAKKYAEIREAFGIPIGKFPLLSRQLQQIENSAHRSTAGAFKLYKQFLELDGGLSGGTVTNESEEMGMKRFDIRELIMLQKMTASWDAVDTIRTAMTVFGGHGVMEDFSALPRIFRDAVVNELWEGPRNVLLSQIHRDFQRNSNWYKPSDFVARILEGADEAIIKDFSEEITELTAHPNLVTMNEETIEICGRWDAFCHCLFHAYQDLALSEVLE